MFEIYIKTTPERLWEAITDPEMRAKYSFGVAHRVGLDRRAPRYKSAVPGVIDIAEGENVEVDPPRRLVQTFTALWSDEVKAVRRLAGHLGDRDGRRDSCRLTVDPRPAASRARTPRSTAAGR